MTIETTANKAAYSGDGSTTLFTFPYPYLDEDHIKVVKLSAAGVESPLAKDTDYTVSAAGPSGFVTLASAPAVGESVVIYREVELTQPSDYGAASRVRLQTVENDLDRLAMMAQQLEEKISRALKVKISSSNTDIEFPEPDSTKVLGWDEAGDLENKELGNISTVTLPLALNLGGTGAASAEAARDTLELGDAAVLDAGTSDGNVVQVQAGGKLPALDSGDLVGAPYLSAANMTDLPSGGVVLQVVSLFDGDLDYHNYTIPIDNTKPLNSEGAEWNKLAITPISDDSTIYVEVNLHGIYRSSSGQSFTAAVFLDSETYCRASGVKYNPEKENISVVYAYNNTSNDELTWSVRTGATSGYISINASYGNTASMDGTMASGIIIKEVYNG